MKQLFKSRINKKTLTIILICFIFLTAFCINSSATFCGAVDSSNELSTNISSLLDGLDFSALQQTVSSNTEVSLFDFSDIKSLLYKIISGEEKLDYTNFFQFLISTMLSSLKGNIGIFTSIIAVAVLCSIIGNIRSKTEDKSTSNIINFVCFSVVIILMSSSILGLIKSVVQVMNTMTQQMDAIFPIILTLMASIGGTSTVGLYQPVVAILSSGLSKLVSCVIVPIFMLSFVLSILGNLSSNIKLDKYNSFLNSLFKWIIGIVFTLFFTFLSLQGITASSFDSVSIRATKWTMSSYVPIVGGYLSQGFDFIMSSAVLIKNALGFIGIVLLISTILSPLLNIIVFSLALKITSAIIQPINSKITNFLHEMSHSVNMLVACILVFSFMYILTIGLLMASVNIM